MKYYNDKNSNESGRSMVEMLGVIAIIMVLTIVGIGMYAKGMDKYKVDKVIDQVARLQSSLQEFYTNNRTWRGLCEGSDCEDVTSTAIELGMVPEDMIIASADGTKQARHALSGDIKISIDLSSGDSPDAVNVEVLGLTKEQTIAVSTANWSVSDIQINE